MKLNQYVTYVASLGKPCFTLTEALKALGVAKTAVLAALNRLEKKGEICSPARGFYLIVRPEYRSLGCLPPEHFISNLMQFLQLPYYICLLSAAQFYGAVHQQPQVFQVMLEKNRAPIKCGRVQIHFTAKAHVASMPINIMNTPTGLLRVATPEVTALDLVMYSSQSGGLNHVATILTELVEKLDCKKLSELAISGEVVRAIQRVGYLLEQVGAQVFANTLWTMTHPYFKRMVPLSAKAPIKDALKNQRWKININTNVESDI